ncbi:MAG: ABC transporter permease [Hyphomicrobiales bacterium]|nr:ABC transporter permease [Hyphomicrobiales bacterium]
MTPMPLALRLALRELRGGLRGFYVFLACIALGVAAIAGVNSVSRALTEGIAAEGRTILGGDIAFRLAQREASAAERAFLDRSGKVGTLATMRAMARRSDGAEQTLVELKAVDDAYPHAGELVLDGATPIDAALAEKGGVYGALAVPELLDRLQVGVGERIALGAIELEIRDTIRAEPDRLSDGIGFGPRLMVSLDALRATGLVRPGSLIRWTYRLALADPREAAIAALSAAAAAEFPQAGWRIRTRANASPGLTRNIERFAQFLTLVGLTALVVGGVGVANAISSFVDLKRPAIATFKCLGASGRLILQIYMLQILILAGLGIAIGLLVGAALPFIAKSLLADLLPIAAAADFYPAELALALVYGLLVAIAFSLTPLGRARDLPATSLFADRATPVAVHARWFYRIAQAAALTGLAVLAAALSADKRIAFTYIGAVVVTFIILRLVAAAITLLARKTGHVGGTTLRLAIRNIHRPGALTTSVVLSLGLGLTLLVALALIDSNLRRQLTGSIAEKAPDFFFVDVQNSDRDAFVAELARIAPDGVFQTVPMLRGRIAAVDGVPAAQINPREDAHWALHGDRGLTYSASLPDNSRLVSGAWWPADYDGEPLVSFEADIADAFGLAIGDTVTVNVLGRAVTARLANTRELEWESLAINFVMVFSPNTFAGAPHAHLATLRLADGADEAAERQVLAAVTAAFPAVTSVRVKDALNAVNALIGDLAFAVRIAASLALLVSMLVLGGALAAGHRQRRQDAVILKTLGATRSRLLTAFVLEYGILGAATAVFALAAGTAAAWYVVSQVMTLQFTPMAGVAAGAALIALAVTLGLGLAGTWRILSVKAAPLLRNL